MNRNGDRTVEVELVEEELDDAERVDEHRPASPLRRLPARAWAAVVGVAVVAVGAVTVTQRVQDAAVAERLADVPGLSAPLDAPLREVWRVPGSSVVGSVDDVVLVRGSRGGDSTSAVDLADGTVRHTQDGWCDLLGGDVTAGTPGLGAGPDVDPQHEGPALLVCTEHVEPVTQDGRTRGGTVADVHDPVTGERMHRIDLGLGLGGSWSTVGSDVVSLAFDADDHVAAGRWSLATGQREWEYRTPDPVPPNGSWGSSIDADLVRLEIGDWALALDADTGERLARRGPPSAEAVWGPFTLPGGGTAVTHLGEGAPETTVAEEDGTTRWTQPGSVVPPSVDDGSVPDVLLLVGTDEARHGQRLEAVDAVTGAVRWVSEQPDGPTAMLQGLLLVGSPDGLTALDARTGATRWTTHADAPAGTSSPAEGGWGMVTDGRRVLTLERRDADWSLVVRDVASGGTVWTSRSPVDAPELTLLPDGTVVVGGSGELVALRP